MIAIKPIYRDEQSTDLNKRLEDVLYNLEIENEGINEYLMDLTLNHSERRPKTDNEITPVEHAEIAVLSEHQNVLERVISDLKEVIYSGYEEIPLNKKEHRMNTQQMSVWLGKNVKPLILKGITKKDAIAKELGSTGPTILWRIRTVYGKSMNWKTYVENVKDDIY